MNKCQTDKKASAMEKSGGKMSHVEEITKDKGPEFYGVAGALEEQVQINLEDRDRERERRKWRYRRSE